MEILTMKKSTFLIACFSIFALTIMSAVLLFKHWRDNMPIQRQVVVWEVIAPIKNGSDPFRKFVKLKVFDKYKTEAVDYFLCRCSMDDAESLVPSVGDVISIY